MKISTVVIAAALAASQQAGAELNEHSSLQDIIAFTNSLDQRTNDAYAKAEEGTTIRTEHDHRMNVQSDRIYKAQLTGSSAIHYDGDKVVTTDRDLTDTITGAVMLDEQGNALKVRELQKGSDDIILRGENGTSLHNVSSGVNDRDAVNVSQLKGTAQGLQDSIDGHTKTLEALDAAQQQESKDRIVGYSENSQRITTVAEQKADKSDVNEVRGALEKSTSERIATDAGHDVKIADLYDTKANAAEVNEWLETKADKADLDKTNVSVSVVSKTAVQASQDAKDAQASADIANRENARMDDIKADKTDVARVDRRAKSAQVAADNAGADASKARLEAERLDKVKADKVTVTAAISQNYEYLNGQINDAQSHNAAARAQTLRQANAYTDQKVSALSSRVDHVEKKANAGAASAIAISQIPQAIHAGHGSIGIGTGFYSGQNAVALGVSYRLNDDRTTVKASAAKSSQGSAFGLGASIEF